MVKLEFSSNKLFLYFKIEINEIDTIIMPIQDLMDKFSLIKIPPLNAANIGDKASIDRVFLVPISFKDFR